jgi:hypothetical protein
LSVCFSSKNNSCFSVPRIEMNKLQYMMIEQESHILELASLAAV